MLCLFRHTFLRSATFGRSIEPDGGAMATIAFGAPSLARKRWYLAPSVLCCESNFEHKAEGVGSTVVKLARGLT